MDGAEKIPGRSWNPFNDPYGKGSMKNSPAAPQNDAAPEDEINTEVATASFFGNDVVGARASFNDSEEGRAFEFSYIQIQYPEFDFTDPQTQESKTAKPTLDVFSAGFSTSVFSKNLFMHLGLNMIEKKLGDLGENYKESDKAGMTFSAGVSYKYNGTIFGHKLGNFWVEGYLDDIPTGDEYTKDMWKNGASVHWDNQYGNHIVKASLGQFATQHIEYSHANVGYGHRFDMGLETAVSLNWDSLAEMSISTGIDYEWGDMNTFGLNYSQNLADDDEAISSISVNFSF